MLIHAEDDFDIPSSHSTDLFDMLLEPSLPPPALTREELMNPISISPNQWSDFQATEIQRRRVREDIVQVDQVEGFGRISRFKRSGTGAQVVYIESKWGGHDQVGRLEGVVDIIGHVLEIKRAC